MKRSAFKPRATPMKRTAFIRKPPEKFTASVPVPKAGIKRRIKKPTVAEGSKYLAACRGESCYLRVPGICCGEWWLEAVPCHSNQGRDGKGMGLKASHEKTVPGCWACHAFIDQGPATREEKFALWDRAYAEWEPVRARKMGIEINQPLEEIA